MDPAASAAFVPTARMILSPAPAAELAQAALEARAGLELPAGSDGPSFIIVAVPPAAPEDLERQAAAAAAALRSPAERELEAARAAGNG